MSASSSVVMHRLWLLLVTLPAIASAVSEELPTYLLWEEDQLPLENNDLYDSSRDLDSSWTIAGSDTAELWIIADSDTSKLEESWTTLAGLDTSELEASCLGENSDPQPWSRVRPRNEKSCPAATPFFKEDVPDQTDLQQKVWDLLDPPDDDDNPLPDYSRFQDPTLCPPTHPYHLCCEFQGSAMDLPLMGNPVMDEYHFCHRSMYST
jgi:hypothetical protein